MEVFNLNIRPGKTCPVIHCSQFDKGRTFRANLYDGSEVFTLTAAETLSVIEKKSDGNMVTIGVTNTSDSYVEFATTEQMTALAGPQICELRIVEGDTLIGSANFILDCEESPDTGIESESEIHNLETQIQDINEQIVPDMVAEEVSNQYDSQNVIFDDHPTEGHGTGYAVTSEGVKNALVSIGTIEDVEVASFSDGADDVPVSMLIFDIEARQEGSGTPSPSNPRAISGWSECNIHKSGVNLWDEEWEVGYIIASNGTNSNSQINIRSKNYIPIKPNVSLYLKANIAIVYCPIFFYDKDKNFLLAIVQTLWNRKITTPKNAYYMRFYMHDSYGTTYNNDISINYPSSDTQYHSYIGNTYTVDFEQTVYGGHLNVTTSELTITHGYIASYNGETINEPWISSIDNYAPNTSPSTGAQVVYPLTTPTTLTITSKDARTSLGNNNIFADTGVIEKLVYFKTGCENIAKLIEAAPNLASVQSVNGQTGEVELTADNIPYDSENSIAEKIETIPTYASQIPLSPTDDTDTAQAIDEKQNKSTLRTDNFLVQEFISSELTVPANGALNVTANTMNYQIPSGYTPIAVAGWFTGNNDIFARSIEITAVNTQSFCVLRNVSSTAFTGIYKAKILFIKT